MANRMSDISSATDTSHLPGQGLQRRAHREAQKKHKPDIAGRALGGRKTRKRRAASARRR